MKYFNQFGIIIIISFFGELLHAIIPLPIPASIYGLVIMLAALVSGVLKLEQVKDSSKFLIEIMPIMFVPAAVGLMDYFQVLQPVLLPVCVIVIITTVLVMAVAGRITQAVIHTSEKKKLLKDKEVH